MPIARDLRPEEVYGALDDDEALAGLPGRLASAFGARSVLLHWSQHDGTGTVLAHSGYFTDDQLFWYSRDFAAHDPWLIASRQQRAFNRAVDLGTLVSPRAFETSLLFNEYIRVIGDDTAVCAGMMLVNKLGAGFVALQRGRTQPPFTPQQIARLERMRPHLCRLLTIRGHLATARADASRHAALLDGAGLALFLVAQGGIVLDVNRPGQRLADEAGLLMIRDGRLRTAVRAAQPLLDRHLCRAWESLHPARDMLLMPGLDGSSHSLLLCPASLPAGARAVALSVTSSRAVEAAAAPALRERFGLTAAESDVALMLLDGADVARISAVRGRSVETVRSQVKAVAGKLGCRRQTEIALTLKELVR